ncbi:MULTISPECIES: hypothetical protein [unclassified Stenotrophomonas]|uniref:hypothetical protein n=1 Tax=unclassified Stenotrophomonas TaxID=196198 RepID=UPI00244C36D2|nr:MULTISPECIES: hypothetical protein [unclassified Stenotrophomonas]MDH0273193.1 hypothetical protein [Stenotrophomonas sp. GD04089]MDH1910708.1 hypothetical protein [Stenotrophomonas sp. GD03794]
MNPSNPAKLYSHVVEWLERKGVDKGGKVNVDDVVHGVGFPVRPSRDSVVSVLETLYEAGSLARDGSNYTLTEKGERDLYLGTDKDLVEDVIADLKNYMLLQSSRTFDFKVYRTEMRTRLNPRQERMVSPAINVLVNEGYWTHSGQLVYTLTGND